MVVALLLAAAMPPASPVAEPAAPDRVALQPTGPWKIDYSGMSCVLSRPFGAGKDQVGLALTPEILGRVIEVSVLSRLTKQPWRSGALKIVADAKGGALSSGETATSVDNPALGARLTRASFKTTELRAKLEPVSALTVSFDGRTIGRLATGSWAKPLAALDTCQADLQRNAGIDPATMCWRATIVRPRGARTGQAGMARPRPGSTGWIETNQSTSSATSQ